MWSESAHYYLKVISLRPDYFYAYEPLGIYYYMQRDWQTAAKMFQEAYLYDNSNFTEALLASICLQKQGRKQESDDYLIPILKTISAKTWYYDMVRYYITPVNDFYVIKQADNAKNKTLKGRILFYIASQYQFEKSKQDVALRFFFDALEMETTFATEYVLAEWETKNFRKQ